MYIFCAVNQESLSKVNKNLVPSLLRQNPRVDIEIVFVNYSSKGRLDTSQISNQIRFKVITPTQPTGFGASHNFAFEQVKPEVPFLIINPDTYLHKDAISHLVSIYSSKSDIGIVEARQLPFSHPKEYNHKTKETPWASGSCMLINPEAFKQVGGFDENFWMYTEDVDLSWRMWLAGYKVLYKPKAVLYHLTGAFFDYRDDRFYLENFWCARNFIYIMRKYWGKKGENKAIRMFKATKYPESFKTEVINNYSELEKLLRGSDFKVDRTKLKKLSDKIKITGFNLYHNFD